MKKLFSLLLLSGVILFSTQAQARNVWRECGIGGMIFKDTGWAAITSNIIWDLGLSATSSNVSSDDLCEGPTANVAKFVHETIAVVEEETVIGEGSHLVTMLDMIGCEEGARSEIIKSVRADYVNELSSETYENQTKLDKAKNYHTILMNNVERNYSSQCHLI